MVKSSLVKDLISKYIQDDREGVFNTILKIISDEESNKHFKSAQYLASLIDNNQKVREEKQAWEEELRLIPTDRDRNIELFEIIWSQKTTRDIILSEETSRKIQYLLKEWNSRTQLAEYHLSPLKNVLFFGPPGCGKTLCALVIAGTLKLPMIKVRTESLISSLLGETAVNLRKIFNSLGENRTAILFFDEFDSIAKSRVDSQEHGEVRRLVTLLLQMLESSSSNILTLMATNHPQLLDTATWRRFDLIVEFQKPDQQQIKNLIELKLKNFPHENFNFDTLFPLIEGLSHADIERACFQAIKEVILNGQNKVLQENLKIYLDDQLKRKNIIATITGLYRFPCWTDLAPRF